jgi:hypothetical protein
MADEEEMGKSSIIMDIARERRSQLGIKDDEACPKCEGSGIWPYNDFFFLKCTKCHGTGVKEDALGKYAKRIEKEERARGVSAYEKDGENRPDLTNEEIDEKWKGILNAWK